MSWINLAPAAQAALLGTATVVDGDTLRIGQERVRLFGVDAPELSQTCGAAAKKVACGRRAAEWLRSRIRNRPVRCLRVYQDRYGRTVARCTADSTDLGRSIVEAGWATAYRRYSMDYVAAEAHARIAKRGIWAFKFQRPDAYRQSRSHRLMTQSPPDPRCAVKGNINRKGERILHFPGSRDYAAVRIDQSNGERWFCNAAEGRKAGWRASR